MKWSTGKQLTRWINCCRNLCWNHQRINHALMIRVQLNHVISFPDCWSVPHLLCCVIHSLIHQMDHSCDSDDKESVSNSIFSRIGSGRYYLVSQFYTVVKKIILPRAMYFNFSRHKKTLTLLMCHKIQPNHAIYLFLCLLYY